MTYNMFGGTLNPPLLLLLVHVIDRDSTSWCEMWVRSTINSELWSSSWRLTWARHFTGTLCTGSVNLPWMASPTLYKCSKIEENRFTSSSLETVSHVYTSATCCAATNCADEQHVASNKLLVARNMLRWCKRGLTELSGVVCCTSFIRISARLDGVGPAVMYVVLYVYTVQNLYFVLNYIRTCDKWMWNVKWVCICLTYPVH